MNPYDRHQLTARELEREYTPPVLWVFLAILTLCAGYFVALAFAFSF
jgi:hypothetical protein